MIVQTHPKPIEPNKKPIETNKRKLTFFWPGKWAGCCMYKIVENKLSLGGRESDIKIHFPSWDKGVSFSAGYRIIIHTYLHSTYLWNSFNSFRLSIQKCGSKIFRNLLTVIVLKNKTRKYNIQKNSWSRIKGHLILTILKTLIKFRIIMIAFVGLNSLITEKMGLV